MSKPMRAAHLAAFSIVSLLGAYACSSPPMNIGETADLTDALCKGSGSKCQRDAGTIDSGSSSGDSATADSAAEAGSTDNDMGLGHDAVNDPASAVTPPLMKGTGNLSPTDTRDCYKVTIAQGQSLDIRLSTHNAGTTLMGIGFEIFKSDGTSVIKQAGSAASGEDAVSNGGLDGPFVGAGDYAVCVSDGSTFGTLPGPVSGTNLYNLAMTLGAPVPALPAENDMNLGADATSDATAAVAPPILVGGGALSSGTDVDCFKITLGKDQKINFSISFNADVWTWPQGEPTSHMIGYTLGNQGGSGGGTGTGWSGTGGMLDSNYDAPGDYALCIHSGYNAPDPGAAGFGPYALWVTTTSGGLQNDMGLYTDAPDDPKLAVPPAVMNGTGNLFGDQDCYKITLAAGQTLTETVSTSDLYWGEESTGVDNYDMAGNKIGGGQSTHYQGPCKTSPCTDSISYTTQVTAGASGMTFATCVNSVWYFYNAVYNYSYTEKAFGGYKLQLAIQ